MSNPDQQQNRDDQSGQTRSGGGVRGAINELLGRGDDRSPARPVEPMPANEYAEPGAARHAEFDAPADERPMPAGGGLNAPDHTGATLDPQTGTDEFPAVTASAPQPTSGTAADLTASRPATDGQPHDDLLDRGPHDSGLPDSGLPDSGRHDSGRHDSGLHDSGLPGSTAVDTGALDGDRRDSDAFDGDRRDSDAFDGDRHDAGSHDSNPLESNRQDTVTDTVRTDIPAQTDTSEVSTTPIARAGSTAGAGQPATTSAGQDDEGRERLITTDRAQDYGSRWDAVKGGFVDEPSKAVAEADALVGELLDELQTLFSEQRQGIERSLAADETSTEDMRLALRRYRSFFDRLLSI